MVFTTRLAGGKGGRNGLENELHRRVRCRRTAGRTRRSGPPRVVAATKLVLVAKDYVIEPDDTGAVVVMIGGAAQSRFIPSDPTYLAFAYLRHLAAVVDTCQPADVVHLGGGGLALARYIAHTHPSTRQIVVEPNRPLAQEVLTRFPVHGGLISVRYTDGRTAVRSLSAASVDLVVMDAYCARTVPEELTTIEFVALVMRALRPDGVLVFNLVDYPGLAYVTRVCATVEHVSDAAIAVLSPKRPSFGNHTVVCARPAILNKELLRALRMVDDGYLLRSPAEVRARCAGVAPLTDDAPAPSPAPPGQTLGVSWGDGQPGHVP
jgi:predicted O-methyltransferase YrrM